MTAAFLHDTLRAMASNLLEREETCCVLCGSRERTILSIQDTWPVARCRVCGLVYLSERPRESTLADLYGSEYYSAGTTGYRDYVDTFERHAAVFGRLFARRESDLRRHATTGRRVLEVGCAHGFLLDYLRGRGWDVEGVEVSPLSSAFARERFGLSVHTGTVESARLPPGSYDAVLLLDVLEHLHRPFDTLSRIAGLLVPGGTLVVQCPWELTHWEEALQAVLRGMRTGAIRPDSIPAHLYFFSPRTLEAVLSKGGFRVTARQSGNYGEVRSRVSPPAVRTGSPAEQAFRFAYFRMGIRRMLYRASAAAGLGNGLIRYATPLS